MNWETITCEACATPYQRCSTNSQPQKGVCSTLPAHQQAAAVLCAVLLHGMSNNTASAGTIQKNSACNGNTAPSPVRIRTVGPNSTRCWCRSSHQLELIVVARDCVGAESTPTIASTPCAKQHASWAVAGRRLRCTGAHTMPCCQGPTWGVHTRSQQPHHQEHWLSAGHRTTPPALHTYEVRPKPTITAELPQL